MILYYGSNGLINLPVFGYGSASNDFGRGFYLTPSKEMADLWASKFNDGYSITYRLNTDGLKILELSTNTKEDTLKWLTLLIKNRFDDRTKAKNKESIGWLEKHYSIDVSSFDIIIGYRADDTYFNYSKAFLKNEISFQTLEKAMKSGNLGEQVVLMSEKAFLSVERMAYEKIEHNNDYSSFVNAATNTFFNLRDSQTVNDVYLKDMIGEKEND